MIVEVAYPLTTANGVGLSPDDRVVYVSETETARLWAFDLEAPGRRASTLPPSPQRRAGWCSLPGYQRFDSMAVDDAGNICVATLVTGCITVVAPGGEVLRAGRAAGRHAPPISTGFGGPDMKTAYVTLSGTGAASRPCRGLRPACDWRITAEGSGRRYARRCLSSCTGAGSDSASRTQIFQCRTAHVLVQRHGHQRTGCRR